MCGIAGIVDSLSEQSNATVMSNMLDVIEHRGPDAKSLYQHKNVTLGHRRLSIIDLSTGDQPMFNHDRSLCIVFNGEIYNYIELRGELISLGATFQTQSDTEVILSAYKYWGKDSFKRLNGIFAFALLDLVADELILVRDHFGIKPLHYFESGDTFIFASEQKAIHAHPKYKPGLNKMALHLHLNLRYTVGNETLFRDIKRLPPAHFLVFKNGAFEIKRYWQLEVNTQLGRTKAELMDQFNDKLKEAVRRQLVSDVPIGVYLSGGLDSSSIVQKMHELGEREIRTFTLGFNEPTDEFPDARSVVNLFNTQHTELSLSMNPLKEMDKVIWHAEEPKINLLQGFNMSKFVSSHGIKVVLGGLGGDELMAGYDLHRIVYPSRKWHKRIPNWLQSIGQMKSNILLNLQLASKKLNWDEYRRGMQMLLSIGNIEKYYLIIRNVWDFDDKVYRQIYSKKYMDDIAHEIPKSHEFFNQYFKLFERFDPLDQVLYTEFHTKMVDDYLLVDDRMSMAHSIEERVPFLDKDLVEFCFNIPIDQKMAQGRTKNLFRSAMKGKLPDRIIEKKKWGFTVNPYLQFKKDLGTAVERELTKSYIDKQGIFNYDYIERILKFPASQKLRWHYNYLWMLLGFKAWENRYNT